MSQWRSLVLFSEPGNVRKFQGAESGVASPALREHRLPRHRLGHSRCATALHSTHILPRFSGGFAHAGRYALLHTVMAQRPPGRFAECDGSCRGGFHGGGTFLATVDLASGV